jgi:hypothetical protein
MEKNNISNTEDIYVKVDQNNLIYIDPNSTIDSEGNVSARNIKAEKLVMYVNLEADIIPRSILSSINDTNTLTSLAKGTLNFLKNGDGQDYDTTWTDSFFNTEEKKDSDKNPTGEFFQSDKTGQSFGISDITISIKGFNSIPTININFIDIRGKTLFESPENSPYKAFFHIPWPIFYLTVKGYYGKAIKYRLHLVKFTSKFNESSGNFEVNTSFVGSTYAYLSDIPLQGILNAPYLFPTEAIKTSKTNTITLKELETIKKSARGYDMLKTVYNEYKLKGLIPDDFPVKTLREVLTIAETLDTLLEKQIFDQVVDMRLFAAMKEFGEHIDEFEKSVTGWAKTRLENIPITTLEKEYDPTDPTSVFQSYYLKGDDKKSAKWVVGPNEDGTLDHLLNLYTTKIDKSQLFTKNLIKNQPSMINNTGSSFTESSLGISKVSKKIDSYIEVNDKEDYKIVVKIEKLVNDIRGVRRGFEEQRDKLEKAVETKMNEIVRNKKNGFGFEPTIRSIFAVILANAEVLVRLMKDVHKRAFDQGETRKKIVSDFSKESTGDSIYPWPELKATVKNKENTIIYPGDPDFQVRLGSDNATRWPEVAFLESYIGIATNKVDPLADKEGGTNKVPDQTESNVDNKKIKKISSANSVVNILPYVNKLPDNFVYEIYERALTYTLIDSFSTETIQELADIEYNNIFESVNKERTIKKLLKENILNGGSLLTQLEKLSPFDKFSYYKDNLPTTDYLKSFYEQSFNIEQYKTSSNFNDKTSYPKLEKELINLVPKEYRTNIYPFSSDTYISYIKGKVTFDESLLRFHGFLEVDTTQGLISGQADPKFWVKSDYETNLFARKLNVNTTATNILNTPYFHKQLYTDFNTTKTSYGKYAGSAYLLLNSMGFTELDEIKEGLTIEDKIPYSVLPSSLFREVSSSQYIPYHLILKWGSIYHRYKKHINEGIDILTGFTTSNTNTTTTPIDGSDFFDNNNGLMYFTEPSSNTGYPVTYNTQDDIFTDPLNPVSVQGQINLGIHPYYDNIFYNVINDLSYYSFSLAETSDYSQSITDGKLFLKNDIVTNTGGTRYYWTQFVDNSLITNKDTFTLLPSAGGNARVGNIDSTTLGELTSSNNTYSNEEQNHFRIIWDDESLNDSFSGRTFASPNEYNLTIGGYYSILGDRKKVMDLIATFNPSILDEFENYFLNFASERVNLNVSNKQFETTVYNNFQDLLKDMVTVDKIDESNISNKIIKIKTKQAEKLKNITTSILSNSNLIKITIGNPKELDPHVLTGFIGKDKNNTLTYGKYDNSPLLTTPNKKLLDLYLGPEPTTDCYKNFFIDNDIEITEDNVLMFRPIVYMYGGFKKLGLSISFKDYLDENIFTLPLAANSRFNTFIDHLLPQFTKLKDEQDQTKITFFDGYNNKGLKVELYNFFKSMNDKWIAGNSIGQRSLLEEFLFLDKANKDIGNDYYFDISRLKMLGDPKNSKISLFSAISTFLSGTGFDLRALPAYVNFYGTNFSNTPKIIPSKKIAQNIFGTFLEVDTQESSPKIVIQYVGKNSTRPDMGKLGKYKFNDDSFNISNTNNNPVMITLPKVFKTGDLSKTNKVVAFEVSFGDQNQSIFKGVTLDQASIKNTTESFYVLENLARSESGSGAHNVDIGLYDYYRQAAYTCDVTCMGNVMIQPTMYFYLKNIPMFKGTYWITEVTHSIKNGSITTSFKGSRMPYTALPDLKDSFMSSYKTLFDKLQQKAVNRIKGADKVTETSKTVTNADGGHYTFDTTDKKVDGEVFVSEASITKAGIPFNGYLDSRYITKVTHPSGTWLRAQAVRMGEDKYKVQDDARMSIVTQSKTKENPPLTWEMVYYFTKDYYFYSTNFNFSTDKSNVDDMIKMKSTFFNPNKSNVKPITINTKFELDSDVTSPIKFSGAIDQMRSAEPYGIALSDKLMTDLRLDDGDIVYFNVG